MKKILVFTSIFLTFVVLFTSITPTVEASESISNKILRIHILANSDSKEDQSLKLKVRDKIIDISASLFNNCNSLDKAIKIAENNVDFFAKEAQKVVAFYGYDYKVKINIVKEFFYTREYDNFTLPAGIYNSIKIIIGKGEGHNWWCVMFPQVCLNSCTDELDSYLTDDEKQIITSGGYIVRFKIVELYEKVKSKFNN